MSAQNHRRRPVIRVFVSSTFADLKHERDALQRDTFQRLETLCAGRGFQFQAIDLRWGVPTEASLDHRTMRICFEELRRSQDISPQPNFLILLGNRYGWHPLPEEISIQEFDDLVPASGNGKAEATLRAWYVRDDNSKPAVYVLQSRVGKSEVGRDAAGKDTQAWIDVQGTLWSIINKAFPPEQLAERFRNAAPADGPLPSIVRFQASATEQEIWRGALAIPDANAHVLAFFRTLDDLTKANDFVDADQKPLDDLKAKLTEHLGEKNIIRCNDVPLQREPVLDVSTDHLREMCGRIYAALEPIIRRQMDEFGSTTPLQRETEEHERFGAERASASFIGRKDKLDAIAAYLQNDSRQPLVIHGESGSGKTALLAKAAQIAAESKPIVRFLGVTPGASDLRSLLGSLCQELRQRNPRPDELSADVNDRIKELRTHFESAAEKKESLVLFLDALDQLSDADNGGSEDNTVRVWDSTTGQQLHCLRGHTSCVECVSWSGDGRRIVSGSRDKTVRVWDVDSGLELLCLHGHEGGVSSVSWSGDGRRLVSGSWDKTVRVWDVARGHELLCLRHEDGVNSASWSGDDRRLVSGSWDHTVRVWDAVSGKQLLCLCGHWFAVSSVSWSGDGRRLVSGSNDKMVRVWDATSGKELLCLRGHEDGVNSVSWSGDGRRIVSGSNDKTVRVWDAVSGKELVCLRGHEGYVNGVRWSGDGRRVVSGSNDQTVRIWDTVSGQEVLCLRGHEALVMSVLWSGEGQRLASGSADFTTRVWDAASGHELVRLDGHDRAVFCMSWSASGGRLVTGSDDNTVRIWDPATGRELLCLRGHKSCVMSVSWSGDGRRLASGSADNQVRVWDAVSGKQLLSLRGHESAVYKVSWSGDDRRLVSGSEDKTVRVWDAVSGKQLHCLRGHELAVFSVSWSGDGRRVVSGSEDKTVRVWDAVSGKQLLCLRGHEGAVSHVLWSGDGRRLVSASADDTVRVWDAVSGECLQVYHGYIDMDAIIRGTKMFPYGAIRQSMETAVQEVHTHRSIAWLTETFEFIAHPSGRAWAGANGDYVALFILEGNAPSAS